MKEEYIMQMSMIENEANQLNSQLQLIEQNKSELDELKLSLEELEKGSKNILVNLGKRIYLPVEVEDDKLVVYIGNNNFIKKSIPDTKKIIKEQIKKLSIAVEEINSRLHVLQTEVESLMEEVERDMGNKKN